MKADRDQRVEQILAVADRIKPMLHGLGPDVQGAVLCELLSYWVAGHEPKMRKPVLKHFLSVLRELVEVNEQILFGDLWKERQ